MLKLTETNKQMILLRLPEGEHSKPTANIITTKGNYLELFQKLMEN